jgi:hypothetical protein
MTKNMKRSILPGKINFPGGLCGAVRWEQNPVVFGLDKDVRPHSKPVFQAVAEVAGDVPLMRQK